MLIFVEADAREEKKYLQIARVVNRFLNGVNADIKILIYIFLSLPRCTFASLKVKYEQIL